MSRARARTLSAEFNHVEELVDELARPAIARAMSRPPLFERAGAVGVRRLDA